ncbi:MAG: Permease of the drug/metabolite transporter (DMT) superfamily, partial [uncultured Thermomicrobiales bacterium]
AGGGRDLGRQLRRHQVLARQAGRLRRDVRPRRGRGVLLRPRLAGLWAAAGDDAAPRRAAAARDRRDRDHDHERGDDRRPEPAPGGPGQPDRHLEPDPHRGHLPRPDRRTARPAQTGRDRAGVPRFSGRALLGVGGPGGSGHGPAPGRAADGPGPVLLGVLLGPQQAAAGPLPRLARHRLRRDRRHGRLPAPGRDPAGHGRADRRSPARGLAGGAVRDGALVRRRLPALGAGTARALSQPDGGLRLSRPGLRVAGGLAGPRRTPDRLPRPRRRDHPRRGGPDQQRPPGARVGGVQTGPRPRARAAPRRRERVL